MGASIDLILVYVVCSVGCILQNHVSDFKNFASKNIYASLKLGTERKDELLVLQSMT